MSKKCLVWLFIIIFLISMVAVVSTIKGKPLAVLTITAVNNEFYMFVINDTGYCVASKGKAGIYLLGDTSFDIRYRSAGSFLPQDDMRIILSLLNSIEKEEPLSLNNRISTGSAHITMSYNNQEYEWWYGGEMQDFFETEPLPQTELVKALIDNSSLPVNINFTCF